MSLKASKFITRLTHPKQSKSPFDRWEDIKSAIDKQYAEYKKSSEQEKRQSIKKQTLHETYIDGERIEEVNNPKTGEKARLIVKNGDDVVSIDNYLNAKYLLEK